MLQPVSRVVDLIDPAVQRVTNMSVDDARRLVRAGDPAGVRAIDGSFALLAVDGVTVRLARSLDRPLRYFLAKRREGPALYVADRIDDIANGTVVVGPKPNRPASMEVALHHFPMQNGRPAALEHHTRARRQLLSWMHQRLPRLA